jgi:putative DNA primase/helicase
MSPAPADRMQRAAHLEAVAAADPTRSAELADWPDPADLSGVSESTPYPADAFPEPARSAIVEYQRYGRQPMSMVGSSALGQMALAAQGFADVARDARLVSPISLNLLVIGESGDRKSAADRQFGRAARAWQQREREARLNENRRAGAMAKDWEARLAGVKKRITSLAGKDSEADSQELERLRERLVDLEQNPVMAPPLPLLSYEDVNPASLAYALGTGWPSAGLFSDEGGAVVGSHGMQDETATSMLALLNILWDGRDYVPTRKQAATAELRGRRFSTFLMLQPDLLRKLIDKGARGIGFLARFLLSAPPSTMGGRFYVEPPADWAALDDFDAAVRRLLDTELPVDRGGSDRGLLMRLAPLVMPLAADAKPGWVEYHDAVERELCRFGEFAGVRDVAAKSAENAVRIAGVFQVFDQGGPGREVERRYVEAGIQIAAWHLAEAKRLFFEADAPQNVVDARELSAWLCTRARELKDSRGQPIVDQTGEISLREIQRVGPNPVRDSLRRDAAIDCLEEAAHLRRQEKGKQKRARINPKLLTPR